MKLIAANVKLLITLLFIAGCGTAKQFPEPSRFDPDEAAQAALAAYDKDGNGKLDAVELEASPALASALTRLDSDTDGVLSAAEISDRFRAYETLSDYVSVSITVTREGQPVTGASMTITPELFMGDDLEPFVGETVDDGMALFSKANGEMSGILPTGFYRVQFSDGASETAGFEAADDTPEANRIELEL